MGHRAAVNVVDFDEKYIVSASGDRTIKVCVTGGIVSFPDPSLEPRLSVPDFVSQLWDKIRNRKPGFEATQTPHPLTRKNGLVNQVKFLWLARAFVTSLT